MWDIVWISPQGHRSVSVSRHFLLQAPQCPCSVRKWFSRDHCCRGTTDNLQQAADFLSRTVTDTLTVCNCHQFSADRLWICVIFGQEKVMENQCWKRVDTLVCCPDMCSVHLCSIHNSHLPAAYLVVQLLCWFFATLGEIIYLPYDLANMVFSSF